MSVIRFSYRNHSSLLLLQDFLKFSSVQFSSVSQSCLTLSDLMNCSMPGLHVHHQHPEFTQTQIHQVSDAIRPSHPLSSTSPLAPNPSQHQSLFQWVNSSHEVAKVLEFQLQCQSFQRTPRTDLFQNGLIGSSCSPRDSQESSPTPQFKSINSLALSFLHSAILTSIRDHWKTIALTRWTFVGKLMCLLFNMLSRLPLIKLQPSLLAGLWGENSAVATGLEKVSFHSNPKEKQCQRMLKLPYNCTHLTP